jgi:hypothetical protein
MRQAASPLSSAHLGRSAAPAFGPPLVRCEPHFLKFRPRIQTKAFFVPENGFACCLLALESTDFRCNPYAGTAWKIETVFLS